MVGGISIYVVGEVPQLHPVPTGAHHKHVPPVNRPPCFHGRLKRYPWKRKQAKGTRGNIANGHPWKPRVHRFPRVPSQVFRTSPKCSGIRRPEEALRCEMVAPTGTRGNLSGAGRGVRANLACGELKASGDATFFLSTEQHFGKGTRGNPRKRFPRVPFPAP